MATTQIQVDTTIAASTAKVFEFLCDLDRHPMWNAGLLEVSEHGRMQLGRTYKTTSQLMGRTIQATNRVAKLEPGRRLAIVNQSGPLTYAIEFVLERELSDVTLLVCTCEIKGEVSFFELAAPLLQYLAQFKLKADLHTLKTLVEHDASKPPADKL